jgi:trehalose 2-sulfotransferase
VTPPRSYVLCGTPRTGSTLLCSLLSSTGVAGHPDSYFREADEATWAERFGVAVRAGAVLDYEEFAAAVKVAATSENGVCGLRVMWGSLEHVVDGLARGDTRPDMDVLQEAFGPLTVIHLRRRDIVAQAASWARAEQTGYWQDGDVTKAAPRLDIDRLAALVETVRAHNRAWGDWFSAQGLTPLAVTYEDLVRDRRSTVATILAHLGVAMPPEWRPDSSHAKQADELNARWARAYRTRVERGETT